MNYTASAREEEVRGHGTIALEHGRAAGGASKVGYRRNFRRLLSMEQERMRAVSLTLFAVTCSLYPFMTMPAMGSENETITLKCVFDDGTPIANLSINFAERSMRWSVLNYSISHINDRYISAYLMTPENVGGETWVLDRITGKFVRAGIVLFCASKDDCASPKLGTEIERGVCSKGVF